MQVRIRPVNNGWHEGYHYEWQPLENKNGKWYQLWSKNIMRYPYGDGHLRRQAGIETHYIRSALLEGLPVQARASYDRRTHTMFIKHNGGDTKQ